MIQKFGSETRIHCMSVIIGFSGYKLAGCVSTLLRRIAREHHVAVMVGKEKSFPLHSLHRLSSESKTSSEQENVGEPHFSLSK